jgi:primosomal protein N' (replication factor Y)
MIIDSENNKNYKLPVRPHLDIRTVAEILAQETGRKLVLGDMFLRIETIARHRSGELEAFAPLKFRALSTANNRTVDMRTHKTEGDEEQKKPFTVLSPELKKLIEETKRDNEHIVLFVSRRGMHPMTTCGDCGQIIECENCTGPMTLHKQKQDKRVRTVFICHKCGTRKSTRIYCPNCESWRLQPLGIGTQLVEDEVAAHFPDMSLFRLDSDSVKTPKKAAAVVEAFLSSPGSVLLGTEMILNHLHKRIDNVAIVSIDSLFALPDFRIHERIFNTLIHLRERTTKNFLIQTRHADTKLFDYVHHGNLLDFYRDEMRERKELSYPPYKTFIKITLEGRKSTVTKEMEQLQELLQGYESLVFPAFIQKVKSKYRMHALIKLDPDKWVNQELLALLRSLPPTFTVTIDPEDLL